ncbi:MAG: GMC family oxidoreductase [Sphingobium sp.]
MTTENDLDRLFDILIVGGGAAGCVLASRLSERGDKQILLLDAGPDPVAPGNEHPDIVDPFCLVASGNSAFRWPGLKANVGVGHRSESSASTPYIQGYGVGGASNINGMGADRGLPGDYDEWSLKGVSGWNWKDVLPYFKKLEHDLDFQEPRFAAIHGRDGPMPIRRVPRDQWGSFAAAVAEVANEKGFPFLIDYNAEFGDGVASVPTNCLPNRRVSAAMAYLSREVRQRPNLIIKPHTLVKRILFSQQRATAALVRINGYDRIIKAKEIIICGGAIQTPALLIRSGIGPKTQITELGVQLVRDSPGVGIDLQNHPCITLNTYLPEHAFQLADNPHFLQNWMRFSSHHEQCTPSDMHLMMFNKGAWHALGQRVGSVTVTVLKPYSKGKVTVESQDPGVSPRIDFNMLSDDRDEARLTNGLRFAFQLLAHPKVARMRHEIFMPDYRIVQSLSRPTRWNAFKASIISSILDRTLARRLLLTKLLVDMPALLTNERSMRAFVSKHTRPQFHPCGTCRMGAEHDTEAVVDGAGRLYGVSALRIADASIFPSIPRGYTHLITIMAAEKLSDEVKQTWQSKQSDLRIPSERRAQGS